MAVITYAIVGAIVAFVSLSCSAREYDAEADIGLVANSWVRTVAANNTERLTAARNAQWSGGKFKFANGRIGPVLGNIRAASKEFCFIGTIKGSRRDGGGLYGAGCGGTMIASVGYGGPGAQGGIATIFTRLDGEAGGAVLRLRGCGQPIDGIQFRGRPYLTDSTGEGPLTGTKTQCGIEIEAHNAPPTGRYTFRDLLIGECIYGICCRAGYYDEADRFVAYENHGDNGTLDTVRFWNVEKIFRSECQQSVCWNMRGIEVNNMGGRGLRLITILDIVRGGDIWMDGLSVNAFMVEVLKVQDYSVGAERIVVHNLKWDQGNFPWAYLTLFRYAGPVWPGVDISCFRWDVEITGNLANSEIRLWDASKLIVIPDEAASVGIDRSRIRFNINRLPLDGLVQADGPWVRPADRRTP